MAVLNLATRFAASLATISHTIGSMQQVEPRTTNDTVEVVLESESDRCTILVLYFIPSDRGYSHTVHSTDGLKADLTPS